MVGGIKLLGESKPREWGDCHRGMKPAESPPATAE